MTNCNSKTPVKVSPDIEKIYISTPSPMMDSSPMQISAKMAREIAQNLSEEDEYLQKKQDTKRSISNLTTILHLVEVERQHEQDQEIHALLTSQKEILQKILTQKQTGKRSSFNSAENEVVSQLQNQVLNLEKSVDEKFNIILQSIENNQATVKTYAQVASQNAHAQSQEMSQEL